MTFYRPIVGRQKQKAYTGITVKCQNINDWWVLYRYGFIDN